MTEEKRTIGWIKFWRPTDDWYALEDQERERYLTDFQQAVEDVKAQGAELIGVYKCRGQSEWLSFEAWEFPDIDLLMEFTNTLDRIDHYLYFQEDRAVGRKYQREGSKSSWVI